MSIRPGHPLGRHPEFDLSRCVNGPRTDSENGANFRKFVLKDSRRFAPFSRMKFAAC